MPRDQTEKRKDYVYGEIPGIKPGHEFANRHECKLAGVHGPKDAGIHGRQHVAAFSVVLSGGYEDDRDEGDIIIYSGQGGRKPNREDRPRHTVQAADQEWTRGNSSLQRSWMERKPIRVIRGYGLNSYYAPAKGYVYDGLYRVNRCWNAIGKKGFMMCMFEFERCPNQEPLRKRSDSNASIKLGTKGPADEFIATSTPHIDTNGTIQSFPGSEVKPGMLNHSDRSGMASYTARPACVYADDDGSRDADTSSHASGSRLEQVHQHSGPWSIFPATTSMRDVDDSSSFIHSHNAPNLPSSSNPGGDQVEGLRLPIPIRDFPRIRKTKLEPATLQSTYTRSSSPEV